jgi:cytochrome c oxidase subunit 1
MAAVDIPASGGHVADAHGDPNAPYLEKKGISSWLLTLDHKRIGLMYLTMVSLAFLVGGVFALLVRLELFSRGKTIVDGETYNRFFTLHGAAMVFLFIIPSVPGALGNFFIPIMIGAKDVAFPRLNLLSFYIYLVGAALALTSIISGSVDTGWTFYTPYSVQTSTSVISMTFAVFVLGFSSILTGLNFLVTVHTMRAPGVTFTRLPLFVWGMYATSLIQVLATPVLAITLLLLIAERYFGIGIFDPKLGGDPVLFQHFFWFYSHPAVYIMIVPGMAINSELIATFSRRAVFGYFAIAMSSIGLAVLGFLVWGHHLFVAGMSEFATMMFSALTFLVAIPSGVKVFNWTATIYKGSVVWASPMLYGMAFIFLFTIGGLTGLFLGTLSTDVHLTDTYFVVAHFHYVMMGGTVIAFIGGLLYWWPKMTGKMHDEKKAKVGFWLVFIGFNTVFMPQFIMGSRGMPRRYYDYLPQFEPFHRVSTVGSWILATGLFLTAYTLLEALWKGEKAPRNPWGSAGYEWATETPPVLANFTSTPIITRGPYDYHIATPEELATGWDEVRAAAAKGKKAHVEAKAPVATGHDETKKAEEPAAAAKAESMPEAKAKDEEKKD